MNKACITSILCLVVLTETRLSRSYIVKNVADGKTWPQFAASFSLDLTQKCPRVNQLITTEDGKLCKRGRINYPQCNVPDKRNFGSCKRVDKADYSIMDDTIQLDSISCSSRKIKCMGESGVISSDIQLLYYPRNSLSDQDELSETLSYLTKLSAVNFARNNFKLLSENTFEKNPYLFTVNFESNYLWAVPEKLFHQSKRLVSVNFAANKLDHIPTRLFRYNSILYKVNFQRNNLTILQSDLFKSNYRLKTVDISQNMLYGLQPGTFRWNTNLQELDLSFNRIKRLPPFIFHRNAKLTDLKMSGNLISEIPSHIFDNCRNLRTVTFDRNLISSLPEKLFHKNSKLTYVDFSYNRLHTVRKDIFIDSEFVAIVNNHWQEPNAVLESDESEKKKNDLALPRNNYKKSS